MKKILTLVFVFYVFISNAQNTLNNVGLTSVAPASVAYSIRQLSSSYTGPLVRIKIGTTFYDVYPDASTKFFSLNSKISAPVGTYNAAIAAASANALSTVISGSTNAAVAVWYDQSGNGVHVFSNNATASIITSGSINNLNGYPTIYFNGTNAYLRSTATVNYSAQTLATINSVAQNVGCIDYISGMISTGNSGGWGLCYDPTTNHKGYWVDASGGNGAFSNEHTSDTKVITGLIGTATPSSIFINGTLKGTKSAQPIMNGTTDFINVGIRGDMLQRQFNGNISEIMMFPKNLTTAEQASLEATQTIFLPVTVSITSSATGPVCAGTSVTFTATTTGIPSPTYQWYKNNVVISGATGATFTTTTLSNNDVIQVSCSGASNIVSDNTLALWLDASNSSSYTSGTTWYDLSGYGRNATINSNQTFSTQNGGVFQFNGTANPMLLAKVTSATTEISMSAWVYITPGTTQGSFMKNGASFGYTFGAGGGNGFCPGTFPGMLLAGQSWLGSTSPTANFSSGWQLCTMVITGTSPTTYKYYINGTLANTATFSTPSAPNGSYTAIGDNYGDGGGCTPFNGKMGAAYFYTKALSVNEILQNYNASASRFGLSNTNYVTSNTITTSVNAVPSAPLTVLGDGCINKTTLSTTSGQTSYAWYKDNLAISGQTNNTFTPTLTGEYKVLVSNGTCATFSTAATLSTCGVSPDGSMSILETSTTLVSKEGAKNNGKGIDERGKIIAKPWVYGTVTTATGRIWLDRNLGASRVALSSTDTEAYGDYYQWGRPADGHQTQYLTNNNSSGVTNTKSTTAVPPNNLWIFPTDGSNDWLSTPNNSLWVGSNPASNPCPAGFRIPTEAEWEAERQTWSSNNAAGAFASPLKLTLPGMLTSFGSNGAYFTAKNSFGQYQTQTALTNGGVRYFGINGSNAWFDQNYYKSHGMPCRCIKNQ
jgi:hypothetical protein